MDDAIQRHFDLPTHTNTSRSYGDSVDVFSQTIIADGRTRLLQIDPAFREASQQRIIALAAAAQAGPLRDALTALIVAPAGVRPIADRADDFGKRDPLLDVQFIYSVSNLQLARMEFSLPAGPMAPLSQSAAGDLDEYLHAIDVSAAICRQLDAQPSERVGASSLMVLHQSMSRITRNLRAMPDHWLAPLQQHLARQPVRTDITHILRAEMDSQRDDLAWVFADEQRIKQLYRSGMANLPKAVRPVTTQASGRWPGTYAQNREALDRIEQDLLTRAQAMQQVPVPAFACKRSWIQTPPLAHEISTRSLLQEFTGLRFYADMHRQAVGVMIAIERFKRRTGAYPAKLTDLTPAEGTVNLIDPLVGGPFGYRVLVEGEIVRTIPEPFTIEPRWPF
ncbi:MAG: hypothetical protein MUE97_05795, partial [Phycisphaerales bacterium]|nr:hypothetical protein [Phycisphaerales bacterium]